MKTRYSVIIAILSLLGNTLIAQQIEIKEVDESKFPLITITLEFPHDISVDFNELKVIEKGDQTEIKVDSSYFDELEIVCFLVDESLLTSSVSKEIISNILVGASDKLQKTDLLNVLFTGSNEGTNVCMQALSFEFTSDYLGLINQFKSSLLTGKASSELKDLYCSVDASLDFIQSKSAVPGEKFLVLLKNSSSSIKDWQSLQAKADVHLVKLKSIEFPAELTQINEQLLIDKALNQIDSLSLNSFNSGVGLKQKLYQISFYTKQNGKLSTFELKYKGQELTASFRQPGYSGFLKKNLVFILVIAFLLILSIYLTANVIRIRKRTLTGKKITVGPKSKLENSSGKIVSPISPKKTNYGSITPYITIALENQIDKFELKKLRTTIGRHGDNDILIANLTISNHHAIITNEGGVFYIQDNNSTNGTFVNDIKITKSMLKTEDSVRLGKAKLILTY